MDAVYCNRKRANPVEDDYSIGYKGPRLVSVAYSVFSHDIESFVVTKANKSLISLHSCIYSPRVLATPLSSNHSETDDSLDNQGQSYNLLGQKGLLR